MYAFIGLLTQQQQGWLEEGGEIDNRECWRAAIHYVAKPLRRLVEYAVTEKPGAVFNDNELLVSRKTNIIVVIITINLRETETKLVREWDENVMTSVFNNTSDNVNHYTYS